MDHIRATAAAVVILPVHLFGFIRMAPCHLNGDRPLLAMCSTTDFIFNTKLNEHKTHR